ncbi:hypothetical protein UC34_04995 [Pandoraea vervacti]|uniref:Uncharacterized protein n=1 Tax=Pandoraea vervacti TaxID=656178 RepID=A0ABM5SVL9_9BURK|nr:hypothetical protein [Pandoraea vervacti]AJP56535.1 hypothetical protein UC34_04995 [Pandoraea vervacti]
MIDSSSLWNYLQIPVAALASALFTSHFQNSGHRYRKRWEIKATAYQELIDALSGIELYYEALSSAARYHTELPEARAKSLGALQETGYAKVRQAELRGEYLFPPAVADVLHAYLHRKIRSSEWADYLEDEYYTVMRCRVDIVQISRSDLQVRGPLLVRMYRAVRSRVFKPRVVLTDC